MINPGDLRDITAHIRHAATRKRQIMEAAAAEAPGEGARNARQASLDVQ